MPAMAAHLNPIEAVEFGGACHGSWWDVELASVSGATERFTDLPIDRYVTLVEGTVKWI
jgi:hypothetical protein